MDGDAYQMKMIRQALNIVTRCVFWGLLVVLFAGCSGLYSPQRQLTPDIRQPVQAGAALNAIVPKNEIQKIIKQGLIHLTVTHDFDSASALFKKGLKLNPANPHLHFLMALSYHMMSLSGDIRTLALAETGYLTALRFDDANSMAAYFLGHLYFEQKRFSDAQNQFAYALLYAPDDSEILNALSVSAYYNGDLTLAQWAAQKASRIEPEAAQPLRTLALSTAAAGRFADAGNILVRYQQVVTGASGGTFGNSTERVSERVNDWKNYYAYAGDIFDNDTDTEDILGGDDAGNSDTDDGFDADGYQDMNSDDAGSQIQTSSNEVTAATGSGAPLPKMALIDVVILRTEEERSQAKGINLMDGLRTTLSGTLFGYNWTKGKSSIGSNPDSSSMYIAPSLTLMDLEYNLNIFNDSANKAEVLARPSLLALEHETSRFFSGRELQVQLSSNNADGSMVDVPVGIHLHVTPTFYGNDNIKVTIHASKAFFETVSEEVGFTAFAQTAKTSVDATAVLKFNETLILSGLTENENENSKSGVPLLQSIPGVQYLFSRKVESESKKSILILLTPRKARYLEDNVSVDQLSGVDPSGRRTEATHTLELKKKEKISSNMDALLLRLSKESSFYRQFRLGDLEINTWNNEDTLWGAIKRIMGFVYY